jgi:adenylate cyclase
LTALTSRVVLFADVAGSMELFSNLGVVSATNLIGQALNVCDKVIVEHGGKVVKFLGDGVLAVFDDAESAARTALEIQRKHRSGDIRFKIGIDSGIVMDKDNDLFGDPVGLASRLCDRAHGGEIFASWSVIANTSDDIVKSNQNYLWLKGHPQAVNVYSIEPNESETKIVPLTRHIRTSAQLLVRHSGAVVLLGKANPRRSVGRELTDIEFRRNSVSREHAMLKWTEGEGFVIQDTSRNGTYMRMDSGEFRRLHREISALCTACIISFGQEPERTDYDLRFEFIGTED